MDGPLSAAEKSASVGPYLTTNGPNIAATTRNPNATVPMTSCGYPRSRNRNARVAARRVATGAAAIGVPTALAMRDGHTRVEQTVHEVDHETGEHHRYREEQHVRLDSRQVLSEHGVRKQQPYPWQGEHGLGHDGAAE